VGQTDTDMAKRLRSGCGGGAPRNLCHLHKSTMCGNELGGQTGRPGSSDSRQGRGSEGVERGLGGATETDDGGIVSHGHALHGK